MASAQAPDNSAHRQVPGFQRDERRLQMRTLREWSAAAGGDCFPSLAAMQRAAAPDMVDHSFVLRLPGNDSGKDANPEFVFVGDDLLEDSGSHTPICRLADVPPRTLLSRLTCHYLECVANAAPVGFEASFVNRRGESTMYRGILLPLAETGMVIDHVWGTINGTREDVVAPSAFVNLRPEPIRSGTSYFRKPNAIELPLDGLELPPDAQPAAPLLKRSRAEAAQPATLAAKPPRLNPGRGEPAAQPDSPATFPPDSPRSAADSIDRSAVTMSIETKLAECMSIDGAIAVALVENSSGMAIAIAGTPRNLDMNVAAAGSSNVLRAKQQVLKELGLPDDIEDVLITLASQYHLIRPLSDASGKGLSVYLVLDRSKGNLAMARFKLSRIEKDLTI